MTETRMKKPVQPTVATIEALLPLMQLVLGTLVAVSAASGYALHPTLAVIVGLMGIALVIAGVTGLFRLRQLPHSHTSDVSKSESREGPTSAAGSTSSAMN